MTDSNKISFDIFNNENELRRWMKFANSYLNREEGYDTTVETGYSNPCEHSEEIRELMKLILKKHKRIFEMKHITKTANPENRMSFAAKMRYATKYLLSTGLISIYKKNDKGRRTTRYKCNVDFDTFEEILNAMNEYKVW